MSERDAYRWGRQLMEERADEISCHLAMGEACGWRSGVPEDRRLEEDLLDELSGIEGALSVGDVNGNAARISSGFEQRRR